MINILIISKCMGSYSYSVEGKSYRINYPSGSSPNAFYKIDVYYDPDDPSIAFTRHSSTLCEGSKLRDIILMTVGIVIIEILLFNTLKLFI